jgi:hypothetical protein
MWKKWKTIILKVKIRFWNIVIKNKVIIIW